jgi:hypothetical protein
LKIIWNYSIYDLGKVEIGGQDLYWAWSKYAHPTRVLLLIGIGVCEDGIFGDFMVR